MKFIQITAVILVSFICSCKTVEQQNRLNKIISMSVDFAKSKGIITEEDAEFAKDANNLLVPVKELPTIEVTSGK